MSKSIEKEILDMFELLEKQCDKSIKPLLQAYKRELNIVRNEIYTIWGKYTLNGELTISNNMKLAIMRDMEKKLVKMASRLGELDEEITTNILTQLGEESYYRTAFILDKACKFNSSFSLITKELIESIVFMPYKEEMFSDRIWKNKTKLVNNLRDIIETGIIQGKNSDKIARLVAKEFGSSAYDSKRLIRTEMARVTGEAQDRIYKNSNVVSKVMYVATLDGKTCSRCREYDGQVFDKNDPSKPQIPLHPMTRSRYIGIVDGYIPTTRINNETKETIEYKTYKEWYKAKVEP